MAAGRRRKVLIAGAALAALVVAALSVWVIGPWIPSVEIAPPGPTGHRIDNGGVFGNYFPAFSHGRGPAVLALGGSEGGIGQAINEDALALQKDGFSALALGYFAVPGQPQDLEKVPLETFDRALSWLERQPGIDPAAISIMGVSKGAEAALLVATRHPELHAVVAGSPSSVVWQGINWRSLRPVSSWSVDGRPVAFLPYGRLTPSLLWGNIGSLYRGGLPNIARYPKAVIHVETIGAPVLVICGTDDTLWPSCDMARQLQQRARARHGPQVRVLSYADAGHLSTGPPLDPNSAEFHQLGRWGGSPEGNERARLRNWPQIVAFLNQSSR